MDNYLFISNIIPGDDLNPEIDVQKATYLAQKGIIDGLSNNVTNLTVLSYPQYSRYSSSKVLYRSGVKKEEGNYQIQQIPTFNIPFFRIIFRNVAFLYYIIKWCLGNKADRHIIQYNVSSPSLFVTLVGHWFRKTDISVFLYDLGMPPKSYGLSAIRRMSYMLIEWQAKLLINKTDCAYVINTNIAKNYATKIPTILVDGGLSSDVLRNIPLPDNRDRDKIVLLLAGNLTESNGVLLLLETTNVLSGNNYEFWFAGKGDLVDIIKSASTQDKRIVYKGFCTTEEIFHLYSQSDILLNLRIMPKGEGDYLFPSKLIEYLATGRRVITTNFAHVEDVYSEYCDVLFNKSPQDLSFLIQKIMNELERDIKSEKAQKFMLTTHTWDMQVRNIISYLKNSKKK